MTAVNQNKQICSHQCSCLTLKSAQSTKLEWETRSTLKWNNIGLSVGAMTTTLRGTTEALTLATQRGASGDSTVYVHSTVHLRMGDAILPQTISSSNLIVNQVALKQRTENNDEVLVWKTQVIGPVENFAIPQANHENLPQMTKHKMGQTGADSVTAACASFPNHRVQGKRP